MRLKIKEVNISSGGPLIAILNIDDANKLDLHALDRIKIKKGKKSQIVAIDITDDKRTLKTGHIGLFEEVLDKLKIKRNQAVEIFAEPKPRSIEFIRKKLDGESLSKVEIDNIIKDIVDNKLTEVEITYFVSACFTYGLTIYESAYLTEAIAENGKLLKFNKYPILDKHSVGGIPNNRTTMIIVPIIAAAGYYIPKTSTRSITSVSGTADTMDVLAKVAHTKEKIMSIVKKTHGCIVWGGALDMATADDKLIKIEKVLSLDPEGILLASILAKKYAAGTTHLILDIPYGKGSKIEDKKKAKKLKRNFKHLGKLLGMEVKVILTDGRQPIGNGIGPALEARDVLLTLQNRGPVDLKKKSLKMAELLLKSVGVKNAKKKVNGILKSGLAYKKMMEIIKEQNGNSKITPEKIKIGKYKHDVKANKKGTIKEIFNRDLVKIAKAAGAPKDKGAGIYVNAKLRKKVKKNEILYTIYAESKNKLQDAVKISNNSKVINIDGDLTKTFIY